MFFFLYVHLLFLQTKIMLNLPCRVVVLCSLYSACQGRSLHRRLTNDLTEVHLSTFWVKRDNTVLVCVWNITYSLLKYTQVSVLCAVSLFPRGLIIEEIVFLELSRKNWVSRLKWHYFFGWKDSNTFCTFTHFFEAEHELPVWKLQYNQFILNILTYLI